MVLGVQILFLFMLFISVSALTTYLDNCHLDKIKTTLRPKNSTHVLVSWKEALDACYARDILEVKVVFPTSGFPSFKFKDFQRGLGAIQQDPCKTFKVFYRLHFKDSASTERSLTTLYAGEFCAMFPVTEVIETKPTFVVSVEGPVPTTEAENVTEEISTTMTSTESNEASNNNLILVILAAFLGVILLAIFLVLVLRRRRVEVVEVARNDLYGTYEEGVVYSTVQDTNSTYAEVEDTGEEWSRTTDRNSQYGY